MEDRTVSVKISMPNSYLTRIDERCKDLGISRSEYLRYLATLDLSSVKYEKCREILSKLEEIMQDISGKLYLKKGADFFFNLL